MECTLLQSLEDTVKVFEVSLEITTVDQDVVEEYHNKFANEWTKQLVHRGLECRRRIAKAKRHYNILIVALVHPESRFRNIMLHHTNLMKTLGKVHFRKSRGVAQIIKELVNCW